MGDIQTENYKKSVEKIIEHWGGEIAKIGKELAALDAEIAKLEAQKSDPAAKKKADDLKKRREAVRAKARDAAASLELNLKVIEPPPTADPKELVKLPAWMKDIIKRKGLPLGKNATIAPTVDFDLKAKKLKQVGIKITW